MNRSTKTILSISLVVLLLIGGCVAFFLTRFSSINDHAEEFFQALSVQDLKGAYAQTTPNFRESTATEDLQDIIEEYQLFLYQESKWSRREFVSETGTLTGSLKLSNGQNVRVKVELLHMDGEWLVNSVHFQDQGIIKPSSHIKPPPSDGEAPSEPERDKLLGMAQDAMIAFKQGLDSNDMTPFYDYISPHWQSQTTPEQLAKDYAAFLDGDLDLSIVERQLPDLVGTPSLNGTALIFQGSYPLSDTYLVFQMMFNYEEDGWELKGLRLKTQ